MTGLSPAGLQYCRLLQDPWVCRRNLQMLTDAGVDFLYIDVTKGWTYLNAVDTLCKISLEMRSQGIPTPYICFLSFASSGVVINRLYNEFYAPGKYKDLWFYWQGKPLIMGKHWDPELSAEAKDFFTFRYSWAWTNAKATPHHWQWIDNYPQDFGWDTDWKVPEQVPVAVASHATLNIGGSYHNGAQPPYNEFKLTEFTGQGLHFAEQWRRALELDPTVIMVTQWNEWTAMRFINGPDTPQSFLGIPPVDSASYFVDAYNQEYNRDMEPMKDGHTDNRYYQLVANVRRFKGVRPLPHADRDKTTGWEGYDYAINLEIITDSLTTLSAWQDSSWQEIAQLTYHYAHDQIEVKVPQSLVGQSGEDISFYFHWADNVQKLNDITEFFINGDSAPNRRFNYHFTTIETQAGIVESVRQPNSFALHNFPNPFNDSTTIYFRLEKPSHVNLSIYNITGQKIKTLLNQYILAHEFQRVMWDGRNDQGETVSSGAYIYRLQALDFVKQRQLIFVK